MKLNQYSIKEFGVWEEAGIELPKFNFEQMVSKTREKPTWVHFGAGNIFRGFIAAVQQALLDLNKTESGIIAVETFDFEIIDRIYKPYDNLSLLVLMNPDGSLNKKVIASIAESLAGDVTRENDWNRLKSIFKQKSLQIVSFTITEKGYALNNASGAFLADVRKDLEDGPKQPRHLISKIVALAYERFLCGELPVAFVSMDNCSHNGEILQNSVQTIAKSWVDQGFMEAGFLEYIDDPAKVAFPWTMIDKITPRPSDTVKDALNASGFDSTEIVCTDKKTYIAPFVNAEGPQYLVVEDSFPNGRIPLELAGVYFTDRQTVDRVEKMKVCTCLNPLHTALAVYGCLFGYKLIADEMKDPELKKLVEKIGYEEGMPVVVHPGILDPADFIREVLEVRLPNPNIPDMPQRIATDTSQKMPVRFGETLKAYQRKKGFDLKSLQYIPLVIAGWCRYLLGLNDLGEKMELSPDPMLDELQGYLQKIEFGNPDSLGNDLNPILSNPKLFGLNLYEAGLGEKVEGYFKEMLAGKHAVRNVLRKYL
ncbi:MAG: mannitol dehydrogenase family protein [Clostridia bacterium]|nr:mannitol dehydrogenase family protein [Clostridia bacterium]